MGSCRYRSLIEGLYYLIEAVYTLNSPPAVSFNFGLSGFLERLLFEFV